MSVTQSTEPLTFMFADDGAIPNNPRLPLLVYRGAIDLADTRDPEARIEKVFHRHRWGDSWRNGIYPFAHYHSMIHEALGVARGRARVRFGGEFGETVEIESGDVAVLPAGTGHQGLWVSSDFCLIGAYPKTGTYNLFRGSRAEHAKALETIPNVPPPETDPAFGADGPLLDLWRR
jgi:uncharacterized protein YjlB